MILNNYKKLFNLLNKNDYNELLLFTHFDPDGDAIGSIFAFKKILKYLGINSKIFLINYDFPLFLFDFYEEFYLFENNKLYYIKYYNEKKFNKLEIKFDLIENLKENKICVLDSSNYYRIFNWLELSKNDIYKVIEKNTLINIDHHFDNNIKATINFVLPNISSTSEIIINIIKKIKNFDINVYEKIVNDKIILTYLAEGIIYDTYCFQNKNTNISTFKNSYFLLNMGADFEKAKDRVLKNSNKDILKIWGKILLEIDGFYDDKVILAKVSYDFLRKENIDPNIVSNGFINHLNSIKNSEAVIFIIEKEYEVKGSVRAKNDFAYNFCKNFGGGGHPQASGFIIKKDKNFNFDKFIEKIKEEIFNLGQIYFC
ncbi:MAG: DHH family phosphoesterase [Spirochaetes bacterium]|nr:DHH family phosphoesterase [Spirochaetota bacterium]